MEKITRGKIILTELEGKVIPYMITYRYEDGLLDVYCMNCGKIFASGYSKKSLKQMFKTMNVIEVINVNKWLKGKGYKPNVCKTPVRIN